VGLVDLPLFQALDPRHHPELVTMPNRQQTPMQQPPILNENIIRQGHPTHARISSG
jgi:hypothetical protein